MNSSPAKIKKSPNNNFSLNEGVRSNSPKNNSSSFIKFNKTENFEYLKNLKPYQSV
jgi:hypothetical protein